jgi:hypothetical protein
MVGSKRIQAELKHLTKQLEAGRLGCVKELCMINDDLNTWQLKLQGFDDDIPGGCELNKDLKKLKSK